VHRWTKGFASDHGVSSKVCNSHLLLGHTPYKSFSAEWKVDMDSPTDTHRHLSHLIGLFPGYAVATYDQATQGGLVVNGSHTTYTKKQVLDAATVSLVHRGNGTGPDANSGWEKMWRAAAWAQLGNAQTFYHELSVRSHFRTLVPMLARLTLTMFSMGFLSILDRICLVYMIRVAPTLSSRLMPTWRIPAQSLYASLRDQLFHN
jgi:hypothetical protein